jgi:predicted N-formylglutamate amidohydrolase
MMASLKDGHNFIIGDNEPYDISDESDYTIPVHGERRGLHHVAIEIRQDLVLARKDQREWGSRLARLLSRAYQQATKVPAG